MSDPRDPYRELHDVTIVKKLDVFAALREAYTGAWKHLGEMLRLIWLPGVLYLLLNMIGTSLPVEGNELLLLFIQLATFVLLAVMSVAWYRFILIGETPVGAFRINLGSREMRYLIVSALLMLLAVPSILFAGPPDFPPAAAVTRALGAMGAAGSLVQFFGLMFSFVCIYFLIRLFLLLPAASIDEPLDVRLVLERTRGNFWRIFALCILATLPLLLAYMLVLSVFIELRLPQVIALFLSSLLLIFFAIVNVAVLAIAYRELIGPPGTSSADMNNQNPA